MVFLITKIILTIPLIYLCHLLNSANIRSTVLHISPNQGQLNRYEYGNLPRYL